MDQMTSTKRRIDSRSLPDPSIYRIPTMRKLMALSPYLMLEIFMPGGTMLALLLYLARRNRAAAAPNDLI